MSECRFFRRGHLSGMSSPEYNSIFNQSTGFFMRWGKTTEDDPDMCPFGPEIMDIEVSTVCSRGCSHCYKSNTHDGENMSMETFAKISKNIPRTVSQIAFGIGDIDANPDLEAIMRHTQSIGIVPNVTINGESLTDEWCRKLSEICGAVAVSRYSNKNTCYDAVSRLTKAGLDQVNIHIVLSEENYDNLIETLNDVKDDPRLQNLGAVVMLSLKKVGRGYTHSKISEEKFNGIVKSALDRGIQIGFDSCSAKKFSSALKKMDGYDYKSIMRSVDSCESTLFSIYVNVNGIAFPCSFTENGGGVDMKSDEIDFVKDVWYSDGIIEFRNRLLATTDVDGCRNCPAYDV